MIQDDVILALQKRGRQISRQLEQLSIQFTTFQGGEQAAHMNLVTIKMKRMSTQVMLEESS